ncbi:phosphoribosylformylglycinamidine synthase [Peptoanaerobacter stomatis]
MRFYVERKDEYNSKARVLENEIKKYLNVTKLEKVRIITGYEIIMFSDKEQILGMDDESYNKIKYKILSDKDIDIVSDSVDIDSPYYYVTRYLDHQYDQSADVCESLLKLEFKYENIRVKTLEIAIFYGDIKSDFEKIKSYYINLLESMEITLNQEFNWDYCTEIPENVESISNFSKLSLKELEVLREKYSISMNDEDMKYTQEYYEKEKKEPTVTELKILDTYWSDHCRHSTFNTILENIEVEDEANKLGLELARKRFDVAHGEVYKDERPLCLMDIATIQMKKLKQNGVLNNLEKSDEVNACSIEVQGEVDGKKEDFILMFKNETHNHPTEMEPFGGAGTCIGGGIRDPLSGRSIVFGAMRITGCSDPREKFEDTLKDKIPQRNLTKTAADGYSDYANQIGLASAYLDEYYHEGFKAKRMECGALVGFNYKANIKRANPVAGDVIVMLGGNTGRDGLGGATGSSKEVKGESKNYSAEVQKGNPIIERNIVRLYAKPEISKLIKKSNDFGAGGVSVAIGEMANSLEIDLDAVPLKYSGMNATEVAISESQERMAVLLDKNDLDKFIQAAHKENLNAVKVATVTDNNRMIMTYKGQKVCDLDTAFLNSGGVRQRADVSVKSPKLEAEKSVNSDIKTAWLENLSDLKVCSKKNIANQFDKAIGGQSVFYPFGGKYIQTCEQGLAMKFPLEYGNTDLGVIMTVGYDPDFGVKSPFHAAYYAVIESVLKAVSMGAKLEDIRLSFQEYFEKMATKESWGKVYSALMGAFLAQDILDLASIGGKDSMSGTYKNINVPPSLISFAVAPVDTTKLVSKAFKNTNNYVYILKNEIQDNHLPKEEVLLKNINTLTELIKQDKVKSSSIVGAGGLSSSISQMCFGNMIGFEFAENIKDLSDLFIAKYGDVIIESQEKLDLELLGKTLDKQIIKINGIEIDLQEALKAYNSTLSEVFEQKLFTPEKVEKVSAIKIDYKGQKIQKPIALVPVFSGTNGEFTLKKQLRKSGFEVNEVLFRSNYADDSYEELVKAIETANIIVIPSGMSGGGKPNSQAKFITLVLSQIQVANAVNSFIEKGGLVIGLGEGFKALVSLGLIQNGKISEKTDSLDITRNPLNRHYADIFETNIVSETSPYFTGITTEMTPVSSTDARVILSDEDFAKYHSAGQIVSVFAGDNPYGSKYGIESMCSANGQVLGRLGDFTQIEEGLFVNVFDAKTSKIFGNIKKYFE